MGEPALRDLLRADARRSRALQRSRFGYDPWSWWLDPGFVCVALFRVSHALQARGWAKAARLVMQLNSLATGADFHPGARIGPGLLVPSPCSTNISCAAGRNLLLMPQAGIGGSQARTDVGAGPGLPLLGDDVRVGQFSGVNGPFTIGDRVLVSPGSGTVRSVAADRRVRSAVQPALVERFPVQRRAPAAPLLCRHRSWRASLTDWRADLHRFCAEVARYDGGPVSRGKLLSGALTNPMAMMFVQRFAHWLHASGWRRLGATVASLNRLFHKISMPADSCIGGGLLAPHLAGLVVEGRVGEGVTLYANVVCAAWDGDPARAPAVGPGTTVGGHGGVVGAIHVGANVHLAPKVQLFENGEDGVQVFSPLARFCDEPQEEEEPAQHGDLATSALPRMLGEYRRADRARHEAYVGSGGRRSRAARLAVRLYRSSSWCDERRRRRRARAWWLANVYLTGADISPASRIGPGLLMPYPAGIAFHGAAGADLTLMAMSGVGAWPDGEDSLAPLARAPVLGNGVRLDHHGQVHGNVRVGTGARIMPGCTADRDVPAGAVLAPHPVRLRRPGAPATEARR